MAKCAEKRTENPYRMSRIRAGFRNRQEPAERLFIDDSALDRYETGQTAPPADRVLDMARLYRDMSLAYRHCIETCPLGEIHEPLEDTDFIRAVMGLMVEYDRLGDLLRDLKDIAQDGVISDSEKKRMEPVVSCMRRLKQKITAVQLQAASQIC